MNVIIISESHKKAAILSRRILSKYLRNIGRRTWLGNLTEEGLKHLQDELNAIANKNTAIACHRVINRHQIELEWIVGSRKQFDEDGNFAFRYTENPKKYDMNLSEQYRNIIKFLAYLNKLAALFHDLGKNFYFFQNKLLKGKTGKDASDPYRHEYLSLLYLFTIYDYKPDSYQEQLQQLKQNIDQLDHSKNIQQALNTEKLISSIFNNPNSKYAILKAISHLIISHHRLLRGKKNGNSIKADSKNHKKFYAKDETEPEREKLFKPYKNQHFVLEQSDWKAQFNYTVDGLLKVYQENQQQLDELIQDHDLFMNLIHYILRPALIMADQSVSAQDSKVDLETRQNSDENPIANLKNKENKQTLEEHLIQVAQQSYQNTKVLLHCLWSNQNLYTIDIPKKLIKPSPRTKPQFLWQNAAVNAIKTIDQSSSFGFFGVVMAKTGTGKTRLNAKLLAAFNQPLRFTTLLGLRALTVQTLEEYQNDLDIKNGIVRIIGDNATLALHKAHTDEDKKNKEDDGIDSDTSNLQEFYNESNLLNVTELKQLQVDTDFPEELCFSSQRDTKLDKISQAPVVVATIDYLINGINAWKSSKSRYLTRLMTSDLIIDEIDSYQQDDLISIHKLCYLTGFYGKKLIISSATIPEILIGTLYNAYQTGYCRYAYLSDKPNKIHLGLFSHHDNLNKIYPNDSSINSEINQYIQELYLAIEQEATKRKATMLDISDYLHSENHPPEFHHQLIESMRECHKNNHTIIDGIKISTGLVKFSNTMDCFEVAKFLLSLPEPELEEKLQAVIKIECYHSRHFPIRRAYVERQLNQLLNRKNIKDFKNNHLVQDAIEQAKSNNYSNIMLVIVSTTIIEIGRDFDFDWGIIEPASHWSIVQTVGRILRHRELYDKNNVMLLSHSMKAVRKPKTKKYYYRYPGPEDEEDKLKQDKKDKLNLDEKEKEQNIKQLFDFDKFSQKIDSRVTLTDGNADLAIKRIEDKQIHNLRDDDKILSFNSYLNNATEYLTTANSDARPFRQSNIKENVYRQDENGNWHKRDAKTYKFGTENCNNEFKENDIVINEERLLIKETLEEIEEIYKEKFDIELARDITVSDKKDNKYNEFLGVL
ncbi:hypothetical protein QUF74_05200 [Candidatus Halobeggiatoa sp. HSG11]|nr:hypothetical protein [Candidatus Halobeggiatoa sp. HSG11]